MKLLLILNAPATIISSAPTKRSVSVYRCDATADRTAKMVVTSYAVKVRTCLNYDAHYLITQTSPALWASSRVHRRSNAFRLCCTVTDDRIVQTRRTKPNRVRVRRRNPDDDSHRILRIGLFPILKLARIAGFQQKKNVPNSNI
jgi:hypothetical protein